ncbi:MAG: hypothetical protein QOE16_1195 [Microbacteriaceae bacterium]|nr:hypothetical protein [Microbacteriaceae bacterium]
MWFIASLGNVFRYCGIACLSSRFAEIGGTPPIHARDAWDPIAASGENALSSARTLIAAVAAQRDHAALSATALSWPL